MNKFNCLIAALGIITTSQAAIAKQPNAKEFKLLKKVVDKNCKLHQGAFDCTDSSDSWGIQFTVLKRTDFDGNGTTDLLVKENTEGSSNYLTSASLIYLLTNKKGQLKENHKIVVWSGGSYNQLAVKEVKGKTLYVTVSPNREETPKQNLAFVWKDGKLHEASYLKKCGMSNMTDKTIFRETVPRVSRKTTLNMHNYTQEQQEKVKLNGISYMTELNGCDNINMDIYASGKQATVPRVLSQLIEHTQWGSVFKQLPINAYKRSRIPQTGKWYPLKKGWKVRIHHRTEGNDKVVVMNVHKINNARQTENWDEVVRRK